MKEELVKFYIWQRNNCNKVEDLKDINEMVDIYLSQKKESKPDIIPDVNQRAKKVCWWEDRNSPYDECDSCTGACNWHGG